MSKYRVTNFSCFIIGEDPITVQCGDMLLNRGHVIRGVVSETPGGISKQFLRSIHSITCSALPT